MAITVEQRQAINKGQQGELNAVVMYRMLARRMKSERDVEAMTRLANDELRHAKVFRALSGDKLKPSRLQGDFVCLLYRLLGRRRLFTILANGEYSAYDKYVDLVEQFPEVGAVQQDEKKHGDALVALRDGS